MAILNMNGPYKLDIKTVDDKVTKPHQAIML